jgi:ribosomal protein L11 methyltransferase
MQWLELSIDTTHDAQELITDFLSSLGADGVQVQDAEEIREILADPASLTYADDSFVDSLDSVVHIKAYFAQFPEGVRCNADISFTTDALYDDVPKAFKPLPDLEQLIIDKLQSFAEFLPIGPGYLGWREVQEEDWAEGWKQYYQTLHLTPRLVINPSWLAYEAGPDEIVISLDPGSAFGTGSHETTAQCAELLDELLLPGDHVLDLGCGSGILAIIASKLGAGTVEAIDIDQLAINVARENCQLNAADVDCHTGEISQARDRTYDLIVANIIADVIIAIAPDVPERLVDDGLFIASGVIADRAPAVIAACQKAGLDLILQRERNDWCAFVFQKKAA